LWDHLRTVVDKRDSWREPFDGRELRMVRDQAARAHEDDLAMRLDHILDVEAVLAPIGRLFDWILTAHDRPFKELVAELGSAWRKGLDHIAPERVRSALTLLQHTLPAKRIELLDRAAVSLHGGAWEDALHAALSTNELVMADRGARAWVALNDGRVDVRYRDAGGDLPKRSELSTLWVNPYYVSPLKFLGRSLLHPEFGDEDLDDVGA
jgi:hypothetical protein